VLASVANLPGFGCVLHVRKPDSFPLSTAKPSENQWTIKVEGRFHANVLDSVLPFISQHVEPQTVFVGLDQLNQLLLQMYVLLIVDGTLEDGILDSLPKVQALLCNVSEASLTSFVAGCNVICDKDQHGV